jgi:hypothetical protein
MEFYEEGNVIGNPMTCARAAGSVHGLHASTDTALMRSAISGAVIGFLALRFRMDNESARRKP